MRVHESARKHGIAPNDAIHAAEHVVFVSDLNEDSPARQLRLGFDSAGRLLEVVVLRFDSGSPLTLSGLRFAYRRGGPTVIRELSWEVPHGRKVVLRYAAMPHCRGRTCG